MNRIKHQRVPVALEEYALMYREGDMLFGKETGSHLGDTVDETGTVPLEGFVED
jgi:hypothetical protein